MGSLTTFTARDAKARFGEVLDAALGEPVAITRHDRLTAYVVSKRDYDALVKKVEELEDELWLARAAAARAEGFANANDVDVVPGKFGNIENETKNDESGPEGRRKAGR